MEVRLPFRDRRAAGRALGAALAARRYDPPLVVLALPRGGVPVAAEVARMLHAPLDLVLVRKIGAPWQPELAVAAVAAVAEGEAPEIAVDESIRAAIGADPGWIDRQAAAQLPEIARRRRAYLQGRDLPSMAGATVLVVDDGIATGTTARAALRAVRRRGPAKVVLAVPVGPADTLASLRAEVDEVVCLARPEPFDAVGCHYEDFRQVSDDEVIAALRGAQRPDGDEEEPR